MTTPDSALNALTGALTSADSPLAANLAEILTDAIQELIEAELSARMGLLHVWVTGWFRQRVLPVGS